MHEFLSWLDRYTESLQVFLQAHIVLAPLLLLLIEEMGVPILIPGDAIIAYVGYGLSQHHSAALWQAFVLALVSVLGGATFLFYAARRYGKWLINTVGRFIFLRQSHIDKAEKLFARYGVWTIIFGRHIPGLRIPITIFAATSGVRYRTFIASTFVSTVLWILFYLKIGKTFGPGFQNLFRRDATLSIVVVVGLLLLVVGLHFYGNWRRALAIKRNKP
jgi:membrane protein DedA with SNARE-associated domain